MQRLHLAAPGGDALPQIPGRSTETFHCVLKILWVQGSDVIQTTET